MMVDNDLGRQLLLLLLFFFFFFKQKTAYDIMPSLVGSGMCIRDRHVTAARSLCASTLPVRLSTHLRAKETQLRSVKMCTVWPKQTKLSLTTASSCLSNTYAAADNRHWVDGVGGRIVSDNYRKYDVAVTT